MLMIRCCFRYVVCLTRNFIIFSGLRGMSSLLHRRFLLYSVLLIIPALITPSCNGSKKTSYIKGIEKRSKKPPTANLSSATSRKERKMIKREDKIVQKTAKRNEKRREKDFKASEKQLKHGINRRHLAIQSKETQQRMKETRKQSQQVNKRK